MNDSIQVMVKSWRDLVSHGLKSRNIREEEGLRLYDLGKEIKKDIANEKK